MARLAEVVEQLNILFDEANFTDVDRVALYKHVRVRMGESEALQEQAKANNVKQFADGPDVKKAFMNAVVDALTNHAKMGEKGRGDSHLQTQLLGLLTPDLYRQMNGDAP